MSNIVEQHPYVLGNASADKLDYSNDLDWDKITGQLMARNEIAKLSHSYERCFARTTPSERKSEFTLITGPSGVGKTSLALTLKKQIADDNGFLIKGKFDQLENNLHSATTQVYSAFTEAFTQYVELVIGAGEGTAQAVKEALELGMDFNELLVLQEMIPALDKILALRLPKRPSTGNTSTLKGSDAEDRLVQIVSCFFRTICSQGGPVILFLDDLQWANRSALNMLTSLLVSKEEEPTPPFMLLCTCRMNEVSEDHQLMSTLSDIKDQGVVMTEIQVSNMTLEEVNIVVADTLHSPVTESLPLSDALFHGTEGNLLFLIELVKKLRDDKVIVKEEGRWTWDMSKVNAAIGIGSISRLIEEKFYRLDSRAQELLRVASCLGATFSVTALSYIGLGEAPEISSILHSVERLGFIDVDSKSLSCRFVHDKVQQTIYQLTPEDMLDELHLNIGRKLKQLMPREVLAENTLLISHQISLGVHLIDDANEKQEVAELFFLAGQKAALTSSFVTASAFLHLAICLLSRRHWNEQYKLSLQMYNFAAEIEFYNGNLQRVDELLDAVMKHAKSLDDSLVSRFTRIYSLGTRGNMREGLSESLDVLKLLGEKIPRRPGLFHIIIGLVRCKQLLRGKSDEYILDLPSMKDKKKEAAMRLMIYATTFAFFASDAHVPVFTFRMVENALRQGMNGMACIGFASLGMVSAFQGNIDEACRLCTLALKIFEKYDAREWQARVVFLVYGMVFPMKYPFRDAASPLFAAHRSSLVLGDIHYSILCRGAHVSLSFYAGTPLPRVLIEAKHSRSLCIKYGQHSVEAHQAITIQGYLNLMGQSCNPLVLTGEFCNEDEVLASATAKDPVTYVLIQFVKLELAVYMNDVSAARAVAEHFRKLDEKKLLPYMVAQFHFYQGLTYAMSTAKGDTRIAKQYLTKLKATAKHAPSNYLHKVYLIEAELAAQAGKLDDALANFSLAIQFARQEGMLQDQALACEHAANTAQKNQRFDEAREYVASARSLYLEWGAQIKVDQLANALQISDGLQP